jgi:hypothetical protein
MGNLLRWWAKYRKAVRPQEGLRLSGRFTLRHYRQGQLLKERQVTNLVTSAGKAAAAGLIIATGHTNAFDYIALGEGTTAAVVGDTTLESEIVADGGERALATLSRVTTDVTNDTAQLVKTFTFTAAYSVTEAGVLDTAVTGGVLLSRQVFASIDVVATDTLEVTWKIDVD